MGRVTDFDILPYGEYFEKIKARVGINLMSNLLDEETSKEAIEKVGHEFVQWFRADRKFSEPSVERDSNLNYLVSVCRLMELLDEVGIPHGEYRLYRDPNAMKKIDVVMRHHFHAPEFTLGFNEEEQAEYNKALQKHKNETVSIEFGNSVRQICTHYVNRVAQKFGLPWDKLCFNFEDLIENNKKAMISAEIIVGGPLTEAYKYCLSGAPVLRVVAQGGTDHTNNVFRECFNFLMDMTSAKGILGLAHTGEIDLILVPTECIKGTKFMLSIDELRELMERSSPTISKGYSKYLKLVKSKNCVPFDLVTIWLGDYPDLLPFNKVKWFIGKSEAGETINFRKEEGGRIKMYRTSTAAMESIMPMYKKLLQEGLVMGGCGS